MELRVFESFEKFTHFVERLAATGEVAEIALAKAATIVLYDKAQKIYGDNAKLAHLAQATQDERSALGYSPDDPLVRDGSLLRGSMEKESGPHYAAIGSPEPIAAYHEFGYINARTGNPVPPRPVYQIALHEAEPEILELIEIAVGAMLGFHSASTAIVADKLLVP